MDAARFDAFSRTLAAGLPRRRLIRRAGAAGLAAFGLRSAARPAAAVLSKVSAATGSCDCFCRSGCDCLFDPRGNLTCSIDCVLCSPDRGIGGGGQVRLASGEATVALVATAVLDDAGKPSGRGLGLLRWVDAGGGVALESVGIGAYGPVGELEGVRRFDGQVLANGAGPYPFVITVTDAGPNGQGADTVSLSVGDAVEGRSGYGFSYTAEGNLASGDLVGTWTLPVLPEATPTP